MSMFYLGLISVIQAVLLPGFIIGLLVRDTHWVDRLLLAAPLSLALNYCVVFTLTLSGLYTHIAVITLFILEVLALALILYKEKSSLLKSGPNWSSKSTVWLSDDKKLDMAIVATLVFFSFFLFYGAWQQFGTVFNLWDDVVSWNRWAVTWFYGELPHSTWQYPDASQTYPQGIPILYSLTYMFTGNMQVQFFAKFVANFFPILAFFTFLRVAFIEGKQRNLILLAISIFIWMLAQGYAGIYFIFSGYVDSVMAYFGVFFIYVVVLLMERKHYYPNLWDDSLSYLAIIAISTAALVKQTGVILTIIFMLVFFVELANKKIVLGEKNRTWKTFSLLFVALLVVHWYVYKWIQIKLGLDTSLISTYATLIPGSFIMRPVLGLYRLFAAIGWAWFPIFIAGLFYPKMKKLALWVILPMFIFWAFLVSYDLRSLFVAFSWFALLLGAGCLQLYQLAKLRPRLTPFLAIFSSVLMIQIFHKSPNLATSFFEFAVKSEQIPVRATFFIILPVIIFLCYSRADYSKFFGCILGEIRVRKVLYLPIISLSIFTFILFAVVISNKFSDNNLVEFSVSQQKTMGLADVNKFMLEYFQSHQEEGYVATAYQLVGFIPDLQSHFKLAQCGDFSFLSEKRVKYYLHTVICPESNKKTFEKLTNNHFEKISGNLFTFYRIERD